MIKTLWGKDGEIEIIPAGHNLFIVQFHNSETRDKVLELGPWHIQNKPLIVRKWEPGMRSLDFNMSKLPLWIQLHNIPLELFNQTGISYIASAMGNPLYMDRFTANQQRVVYAKVCVEVEASKDIPRCIEIELRDGARIPVMVDLLWSPAKCNQCAIFGHDDKGCPNKQAGTSNQVKVWMPKAKQAALEKEKGNEGGLEEIQEKIKKNKDKEGMKVSEIIKTNIPNDKGKSESVNKYAILEAIDEESISPSPAQTKLSGENTVAGTRKVRVASSGVAELMKTLKTKRKGPIDKGKKDNAGLPTSGGQSSSPSQ